MRRDPGVIHSTVWLSVKKDKEGWVWQTGVLVIVLAPSDSLTQPARPPELGPNCYLVGYLDRHFAIQFEDFPHLVGGGGVFKCVLVGGKECRKRLRPGARFGIIRGGGLPETLVLAHGRQYRTGN